MASYKLTLFTVPSYAALNLRQQGLKAQDKYEYAVVEQNLGGAQITVAIENKQGESIKVPKEDLKYVGDHTGILKKVAEMKEQGWEVFSATGRDNALAFILRREKK